MRARTRRSSLALSAVVLTVALAGGPLRADRAARPQGAEPTLDDVVARMSRYVAGYGEQASLIVAVEKYRQSASFGGVSLRPRQLTAEFVIVRTEGAVGWVGYRDVIEADGKTVTDRPDRLQHLFMEPSFDASAVTRISNESARYNLGPTIRNFNVPTTTLFFMHPANVGRFTFIKKGTKRIGSIDAWEIGFRETRRPTLIVKRDGTDVPCEGTIWVAPDVGTVLRTRLQLRHFADQSTNPTSREQVDLQSLADIDVTYERDDRLGLWLPSKMTEVYEGPMTVTAGTDPTLGRTITDAKYADFKKFQTSATITFPK